MSVDRNRLKVVRFSASMAARNVASRSTDDRSDIVGEVSVALVPTAMRLPGAIERRRGAERAARAASGDRLD